MEKLGRSSLIRLTVRLYVAGYWEWGNCILQYYTVHTLHVHVYRIIYVCTCECVCIQLTNKKKSLCTTYHINVQDALSVWHMKWLFTYTLHIGMYIYAFIGCSWITPVAILRINHIDIYREIQLAVIVTHPSCFLVSGVLLVLPIWKSS